jgi:NDP-sugar pyrophosphorylase family protein
MKAIILAGGLGTRLKPFTNVIPKPLMPIGEKAILEIQVEQLVRYGFDQIFLATNYKADYIEKFLGDGSRYGAKLIVSKEKEPLGTAGPVKLLENQIAEPFLVMNGDILSLVDFGNFYNFSVSQDSLLTVGIKKIIMPYAFGNIHFEGDRVTSIEEKPNIVTYALAGIYVMKPGIFSLIPENEYFGIDNLIQVMLARNLAVTKYEIKEYWIDIGRVDDYEKIQEISDTFANK